MLPLVVDLTSSQVKFLISHQCMAVCQLSKCLQRSLSDAKYMFIKNYAILKRLYLDSTSSIVLCSWSAGVKKKTDVTNMDERWVVC